MIRFLLQALTAAGRWVEARTGLPADKVAHALAGAGCGAVVTLACLLAGLPPAWAGSVGIWGTVALALGKELRDRHHGGTPSVADAIVTIVAGAAAAAAVGALT